MSKQFQSFNSTDVVLDGVAVAVAEDNTVIAVATSTADTVVLTLSIPVGGLGPKGEAEIEFDYKILNNRGATSSSQLTLDANSVEIYRDTTQSYLDTANWNAGTVKIKCSSQEGSEAKQAWSLFWLQGRVDNSSPDTGEAGILYTPRRGQTVIPTKTTINNATTAIEIEFRWKMLQSHADHRFEVDMPRTLKVTYRA